MFEIKCFKGTAYKLLSVKAKTHAEARAKARPPKGYSIFSVSRIR